MFFLFAFLFSFNELTCNGDNGIISSFLAGQISSNAMMASLQNFNPITSSSSRPYLRCEKGEERRIRKMSVCILFVHCLYMCGSLIKWRSCPPQSTELALMMM